MMFTEPVINGNILTIQLHNLNLVEMYIRENEITQYAVQANQTNNLYSLSFPMREKEHKQFAALIHRTNSKNMLDKGNRNWYNPDPNDKPPRPTNPRGSGGKVIEAQNTFAVAA
jgi:hypothetical protein